MLILIPLLWSRVLCTLAVVTNETPMKHIKIIVHTICIGWYIG